MLRSPTSATARWTGGTVMGWDYLLLTARRR